MTVAYQGEPGAYSEAAAHARFGPDAEAAGHATFAGAVQAVRHGAADAAVIPVRNSATGTVVPGAEAVAGGLRGGLHADGEIALPIRHALLALPGTALGAVRTVESHPEALRQCARWLGAALAAADVRPGPAAAPDTAGAARDLAARQDPRGAAIAHRAAAARYGLAVLADGIQDDPDNVTTFVVLVRPGAGA